MYNVYYQHTLYLKLYLCVILAGLLYTLGETHLKKELNFVIKYSYSICMFLHELLQVQLLWVQAFLAPTRISGLPRAVSLTAEKPVPPVEPFTASIHLRKVSMFRSQLASPCMCTYVGTS